MNTYIKMATAILNAIHLTHRQQIPKIINIAILIALMKPHFGIHIMKNASKAAHIH